jgi:hypothetical protein
MRKLEMSYEEFVDLESEGGHGYCLICHQEHDDYVDPDGRNIRCVHCGNHAVYGLEELMIMGMINMGDDE